MFAGSRRAELRVCVTNLGEDAPQGSAKLHSLGGSMVNRSFVDGGPVPVPGVVAQQARLAVALFLYSGRRELEIAQVSN